MKKISILCVLMITGGNAIAANGDKWYNYKTYWDRINYSNYNITNYNESKLLTLAQQDEEFSTQGLAFQVAHFVSGNNNLEFAADNYGTVTRFAYNCSDDFNHPDKQWWNIYDGAIVNWIDGGWRTAKVNKGVLFYDNHFSDSDAPSPGETCTNDSFVTELSGESNTRKYFRKIDGRAASIDNQLYSVYVGMPSDVCITYRCAPGYRMMGDPTNEYTRPENGVWCVAENKQCPFYRGGRTYYMKTGEAFGNDKNALFQCIGSSNSKGVEFETYQGFTKGQQFLTNDGGLIDQMSSGIQDPTCAENAPHCTVEKLNTACSKLGVSLKDNDTTANNTQGNEVLKSACKQAQSVFYHDGTKYKVRKEVFNDRYCDFMCEYTGISINVRKKERMDIGQSIDDKKQIMESASCPLFFKDVYDSDDILTCVYDGDAVDTLINAINWYINDTNQKTSEAARNNALQECASNFCTDSGGRYSDGSCTCGEPCDTEHPEHKGYFYCKPTAKKHCVEGEWKGWGKRVPSKDKRDALVDEWQTKLDNCIADANNAYNSSINASSINATTDSISILAGRLAKVEGQFGLSKWRTAEGKFNTARLASDLTAGVVLGTTGALVTSSVVKKKQVKDGFESLECTVGGQHVGDWGDVFRIDGK